MPERADEPPSDATHIHDGDAKTTRCGISMKSKDRFPYVGAEHVAMHVTKRGMVVCPQCSLGDPPPR